ncbi:hypothetical protein MMC34_002183 [Xylographa carneopallida]|nr:hypothetical protein [Xylographa carneopallida]
MSWLKSTMLDKKTEIVAFSSTAIALYGYDQGMMSLINTNEDYLKTMGIGEEDPLVGVIVSVYYLGTAVGAILASYLADRRGRKPSIFVCLATTSLGNLIMFLCGLGFTRGAMPMMFLGRIVMGLGVGGIDAVIPVYSSELNSDGGRGKALAQEFQSNIFGLNMAFAINLFITIALGKANQWSWRVPIAVMQVYPVLLLAFIYRLPETPRWFISKEKEKDAHEALVDIYGEDDAKEKFDGLKSAYKEESSKPVGYGDMISPKGAQFHPTIVTIMGQVNQALTGYGAVSVYGPQIFELLGFPVRTSEYLTLGNYVSYFFLMTFAWMYIDVVGRRILMVGGAFSISICFAFLTILGGLAANSDSFGIPNLAVSIPGTVILYAATGAFGIGWLSEPFLIPTEVFPSTARAQGAAISVVIWGFANFAVTLLTPIGFNNLNYWLFLVFAVTNLFAGLWTWLYSPETGGRSFEENQSFFEDAKDHNTWRVSKINKGEFKHMPKGEKDSEEGESTPLLGGLLGSSS